MNQAIGVVRLGAYLLVSVRSLGHIILAINKQSRNSGVTTYGSLAG